MMDSRTFFFVSVFHRCKAESKRSKRSRMTTDQTSVVVAAPPLLA